MKDNKCDYLFVNMQGKQLTRQGVWKIIKGYTKEANINKDITPHMIRHSCITSYSNGADLHMVKELLGHFRYFKYQVYIKGIEQI